MPAGLCRVDVHLELRQPDLSDAIDQQLKTLGVFEPLEIFATGGHERFNVGVPNNPGRNWPDKFLRWLTSNNLVP